ncbi:hypothetical protein JGI14_11107, partial [Candidatus Kryptonium thompsonii]
IAERTMPIVKSFKIYDEHPLMRKVEIPNLSYLVKRGEAEKIESKRIAFMGTGFVFLCASVPFLIVFFKSKKLRKLYAIG